LKGSPYDSSWRANTQHRRSGPNACPVFLPKLPDGFSESLDETKHEEAFIAKGADPIRIQIDIDTGRLICVIGVAPVQPAAFGIVRIGGYFPNLMQGRDSSRPDHQPWNDSEGGRMSH
jgi:hypothetical protein